VHRLVSDRADVALVNAWGLAASPTGPWWTANEATASSTLYGGDGHKQALKVTVDGGPTGVVFHGGSGFPVRAQGRSAPARFVYACEDGMIRAWTPTVPDAWSTRAEVTVDAAGEAAVFRGLALAVGRLYATDFHNGRVAVYDGRWRRVLRPGAFRDRAISEWYAPFGIAAIGDRVFVTFVARAPVNGNDGPTGGYVDEFDRAGRLLARVASPRDVNAPWGLALAPRGFGRFGGDLLVGNFGDGHVDAFRRVGAEWRHDGELRGRGGKPLALNGLWGLAFGNGGMAGARHELFFASGPHEWRGDTESAVHGLVGRITPMR
jgi:uncharacterized protein (TIGR03118 family)